MICKQHVVILEEVMELFCNGRLTEEDFQVYILLLEKFINSVTHEEINDKTKYELKVKYDELVKTLQTDNVKDTISRFLASEIFTYKNENSYYYKLYDQFEIVCTIVQ